MTVGDVVSNKYKRILTNDIKKRVENNPGWDHKQIKRVYHDQINAACLGRMDTKRAKVLVNGLVDKVFLSLNKDLTWYEQQLNTRWSDGSWATHNSDGEFRPTLFVSMRLLDHLYGHGRFSLGVDCDEVYPWTFAG